LGKRPLELKKKGTRPPSSPSTKRRLVYIRGETKEEKTLGKKTSAGEGARGTSSEQK